MNSDAGLKGAGLGHIAPGEGERPAGCAVDIMGWKPVKMWMRCYMQENLLPRGAVSSERAGLLGVGFSPGVGTHL